VIGDLAPRIERCPVGPPFENIDPFRIERVGADMQVDKSALPSRAFDYRLKRGGRRIPVRSLCPQRPAEPVGADNDARGRSLRADEREFAWRGSIRKETFACA
jgi:hypothetical protein